MLRSKMEETKVLGEDEERGWVDGHVARWVSG